MQLSRIQSVGEFVAKAGPFLLAHEAEHGLMLSLCMVLEQGSPLYTEPPYFAVVEQHGLVVLAALMTPPRNLLISRCDEQAALASLAADVASFAPPGVTGPVQSSALLAHLLQLPDQPASKAMSMRLYRLDQVAPIGPVSGAMRRAEERDLHFLVNWFPAFQAEALETHDSARSEAQVRSFLGNPSRGLMLWVDKDRPVSMTGYSHSTPTSSRVVAVYTPPEHRRRGYASALVAAVSQQQIDAGCSFLTLYTDLANPTSNHIYQQIGFRPVADADEWCIGA
ncbi:MAG: GNAT family N-acetyltransferase [Roseiflexaceae bacterium]|nr:GNAT family N-acetyltransferase [Roseiflexaceae bacterium]